MLSNIYVPGKLYKYWPALCIGIAIGYALAGIPLIAGAMIVYTGWILINRVSRL